MTLENRTPVKERKKLTIIKVADPQSIGTKGAVKLAFDGKDGEKVLPYFTFSNRLFPLIKIDETIDADIETSRREYGGNTYTDRKVTEIYVDGKPAGGQRQGSGSQFRQRSPEQNASIEAQSAYKGIIELMVAKIVKVSEPIGEKAINWASSRLDAKPATTPEPIQEATKSQSSEVKGEGDIIPPTDGLVDELFENVRQAKKWKNTSGVRSFLVNVCHIEESRIADDPAGVWQEVKQLL